MVFAFSVLFGHVVLFRGCFGIHDMRLLIDAPVDKQRKVSGDNNAIGYALTYNSMT